MDNAQLKLRSGMRHDPIVQSASRTFNIAVLS
jgi:hypothetical protein